MSTVEAQFSAAGIAEQHQARADTAGPKGTTVREPLNLNVLQLGPSLAVRGGISAVERLIVDELAGRIALRHVPTMEDGPILREALTFTRALFALQRAVHSAAPVVVHIHFASRGSTLRKLILAWMTLHAGRPLILHAHGGGFDTFYRRLPAPLRQVVNDVFQRADRFVVLSQRWRSFYIEECELSPSQVVVLPNPTRLPADVPDRRARAQVQFLYLGRICQSKGAFDLIRAFASLAESERQRARLVLAGNGEVQAARRVAAEHGARVIVLPWLDTRRRDQLLAASDVFVLPSHIEGMPMAMLEAMASGLPVIVTPVGGIPEVVTDGVEGDLVAPGDVPQLALALSGMINDPARRSELGQRARSRATQFDVGAYATSLLGLYRRLSPVMA
jgi:glycosyltransferase involved in cell wall biosynthesis